MLRLSDLQVGRARDCGARVDKVLRLQLLCAVFALVSAGALVAALRTLAFDVAVRKKPPVRLRIDLLFLNLGYVSVVREPSGEMLG